MVSVLFTEPLLHSGQASAPALADMAARLFGSAAAFDEYRRDKQRRGVLESYAAFAPFNESTRAVEPILPHVVGQLHDADWILDTWCRTGWSGEWLAGRSQRNAWFRSGKATAACWVIADSGTRWVRICHGPRRFLRPGKPLPFRDAAFGLVHAYDSLHRYGLYPFASECLRVARDDAAAVLSRTCT